MPSSRWKKSDFSLVLLGASQLSLARRRQAEALSPSSAPASASLLKSLHPPSSLSFSSARNLAFPRKRKREGASFSLGVGWEFLVVRGDGGGREREKERTIFPRSLIDFSEKRKREKERDKAKSRISRLESRLFPCPFFCTFQGEKKIIDAFFFSNGCASHNEISRRKKQGRNQLFLSFLALKTRGHERPPGPRLLLGGSGCRPVRQGLRRRRERRDEVRNARL